MKPGVQKLLWRSRRGMLELDALFRTYLTEQGEQLSEQQRMRFERLLAYQDQDLFDAFTGKTPLADPELEHYFCTIKKQAARAGQ